MPFAGEIFRAQQIVDGRNPIQMSYNKWILEWA